MADKNKSGGRGHEDQRNQKTGRQGQSGTDKDMNRRVSNEDMDKNQRSGGSEESRKQNKSRSDMGKNRQDTL